MKKRKKEKKNPVPAHCVRQVIKNAIRYNAHTLRKSKVMKNV